MSEDKTLKGITVKTMAGFQIDEEFITKAFNEFPDRSDVVKMMDAALKAAERPTLTAQRPGKRPESKQS